MVPQPCRMRRYSSGLRGAVGSLLRTGFVSKLAGKLTEVRGSMPRAQSCSENSGATIAAD